MEDTKKDFFGEIAENINKRIAAQPNSMCATADEVRICWLVAEVESLREQNKLLTTEAIKET